MKKTISTPNAPAAIGPYSQAIACGHLLFTSGQIPLSVTTGEVVLGGIAAQTEQALKNLQGVLEAGGASFSSVIKTTCFLADMADFSAFNEVYKNFFGDASPARSCVAVKDLPKGVLVEVEAIALRS
ncbi:MAG: RidA family protein [Neisseriales bacterium]|nr:MAG: RidA family protein [Neisseriales bacterium]